MSFFRIIALILICSGLTIHLSLSQSSRRCIDIPVGTTSVKLDTVLMDPKTIVITPLLAYSYDRASRTLEFSTEVNSAAEVCYRAFPIQVGDTFASRDREEYFEDISSYEEAKSAQEVETNAIPDESLFATDNLQKMGAISRSVSFGNTQNVFVNSSLNLQLDGKITDDVNIQAVIADQNIPFQPEGNTQQIRDFDNVYIRLYNEKFDLTAGDVVLSNRDSYFLRYYKNVQGGKATVNYNSAGGVAKTSLAASVAKGQFASIQIEPIEGVQGPYRVRGPNDERFVIVMANSERVFLDGKQLQRGFDRDYIIDYNQAEVTFNPNVLITKFSRIRIDYEYSDQNYSRSILGVRHDQQWDKLSLTSEFYREKDNRNQPLAFTLTNEDKQILSEAGDQATLAAISGIDSVGYSPDRVLYARRDTLVDDQSIEYYIYSTDPDAAVFTVTFSEVGQNNGDYRTIESGINGRIFEWVAPINGIPQGNFLPITIIPTPNQRQMWNNQVVYQIDQYQRVFTDLAFSNQDKNLFATIDNEDNKGFGMKSGYGVADLPVGESYELSGEVSYEYNDQYFKPIDRFRYIEFDRDWSYSAVDSIPFVNERIFTAGLGLRKDEDHFVDYRLVTRQKDDLFSGTQHYFNLGQSLGPLYHKSDMFLLNSQQADVGSMWSRWTADTYLKTRIVTPGYLYSVDRNEVFQQATDSIFRTAMNFREHMVYLTSSDSSKNQWRISYAQREDQLPVEGDLVPQNDSRTLMLSGKYIFNQRQRVSYNFTYRELENLLNPDLEDEITTMGRLDWSGRFLDRLLSSELTYALANSRELRREFIFVPVANGEGTHTWRDDNGDGTQDLTEFYLAVNPDERNYIKVFVPTDEYVTAYNNIFNMRVSLDAPRAWKKQGGIKSLLGYLSNVTFISRDRKVTDDADENRYNPFGSINDENLLSNRENLRTTFFINRGNPRFGIEAGYSQLGNRQLLTSGIESRNLNTWKLNSRLNVRREFTLQLGYEMGDRQNASDVQDNRNYLIDFNKISPQLTWQPSPEFRLLGSYELRNRNSVGSESAGEFSNINELKGELRWAKAIDRTVSAVFRVVDINFEGEENSPIGYELLEALRPGTNYTWSLQWQQRILKGLQMSLGYEGRKSPNQNLVNIGRMQVTALF
ncbi:MAG: hypothetical protein RIF33_26235 [Cyclobacteriaceae bacterium]